MQKKEEIIKIAADLIHAYGYNNLGIKRILDEANIPKGSFYYYFDSKEDLAVSVIEYHIEKTKVVMSQADRSVDGLRGFFTSVFRQLEIVEFKNGCPIGNLILELADLSESIRKKLLKWNEYLENEICNILTHSKLQNKIAPEIMASFIVASFEGAIMKAKLEKSSEPFRSFDYLIFEWLLK